MVHLPSRAGRQFAAYAAVTLAAVLSLSMLPSFGQPATPPLVTGKIIHPDVLGTQTNVGSLPMNMILSPDGKYALVTDMGFREQLSAISTGTGALTGHVTFGSAHARRNQDPENGLYYGLAATANPDGTTTIYASQGAHASIAVVTLKADGSLTPNRTIALQQGDFPAGLALDGKGDLYLAINEYFHTSHEEDADEHFDPRNTITPGRIAVINPATGMELGRFKFDADLPIAVSNFPLALATLTSGAKTYVGDERDGLLHVLDTSDPAAIKQTSAFPIGAHPVALLFNKAQTKLFVANADSDTVAVVDTATDKVAQTILVRPDGARDLPGATPTNLALSSDESRLYVTLGDMNAVAVVDPAAGTLLGYLPTGWYPTAVAVAPSGGRLMVTSAKGVVPRVPDPGEATDRTHAQYSLNLLEGTVGYVSLATGDDLDRETKAVLKNNKIIKKTSDPRNPFTKIGLKAAGITHVFYIVKENRTYDQVLGDVKTGNGDPSIVMFGSDVTPNQHALAARFALLDNFYDCGEVSGDGWPWSTQGQADEYVIKNLPYNYSGRGRNYDFEGQNNGYPTGGFPATDPYGLPITTSGTPAPSIPDVAAAPGGHIWDDAEKAGVSYRNYGFFYSSGDGKSIPDNYPTVKGVQPAGHDTGGISDVDFRSFDLDYPDSNAPSFYYQQNKDPNFQYKKTAYGHYQMPSRFSEFNREFQEMLAKDPAGNTVPAFVTLRFPNDHTSGMRRGKHTPRAYVADNDYAVGQFVEAISKSPIWKHSAIFVIEDDAQNGPDHVDCHRSVCYVISPYVPKATVDHTFHNTDSVLKTIEQLLGLPPMSQYDAVADPIQDFGKKADNSEPFAATMPPASIIGEVAPDRRDDAKYPLTVLSENMDFVHPDSAPADVLNEVLWKSVKGMDSTMPAPRMSLIQTVAPKTADPDGDGD